MSLYLLMNINEFCRLKYFIFVHASILQNIVRKSQGKSVSLYLLMNINEFCRLKYFIFVHASILQNIVRKSQGKSVTSYLLMNITDSGAVALSSRV